SSRYAILVFAVGLGLGAFGSVNPAAAQRDRYDRRDDDRRYDDRGQYDRGRGPNEMAARMGEQDGFNDGRKDRETGHSNRPTQGDNYKNATRGFSGGAGETAYKAAYRQAYVSAYQEGYNERRGRR